jgi:hypothetical protein
VSDHAPRSGADDAARYDAGREKDAQKRPHGKPRPGAVLGGLFVLVDVDLALQVLVHHGGVVGAYDSGGVQALDYLVVPSAPSASG